MYDGLYVGMQISVIANGKCQSLYLVAYSTCLSSFVFLAQA